MANKKEHPIKERIEKKVNKKEKKLITEENMMILVIIILVISLIILLYPNFKNRQKTYSVKIIKIWGCEECFDLDLILSVLNQMPNIKVKEEKTFNYDSIEAKELTDKYKIKKIPAIIVLSRNVDKIGLSEQFFRIEKNTAIFDKPVPYLEIETKQIKGFVNLIEVYDPACKECRSPLDIKTQLERMSIKIEKYEMIDSFSSYGKELIKQNNISYLPTLLISKDIKEYWWIYNQLENSLEEKEKYYVLSEFMPPYKEISTGKVKGKVKATYLLNESCTECSNISIIKDAFQKSGIYFYYERIVDIKSIEGRDLTAKYNITVIPTVIFSEEILDYDALVSVLRQIGSFEKDGKFIFRKLETLDITYQEI